MDSNRDGKVSADEWLAHNEVNESLMGSNVELCENVVFRVQFLQLHCRLENN